MTTDQAKPRRILEIRRPGPLKLADVEYRVVKNNSDQAWNVFRNSAPTQVSARKKKKSAVDSAIRDAKAELAISQAAIIVICVEGRTIETVWKTP